MKIIIHKLDLLLLKEMKPTRLNCINNFNCILIFKIFKYLTFKMQLIFLL